MGFFGFKKEDKQKNTKKESTALKPVPVPRTFTATATKKTQNVIAERANKNNAQDVVYRTLKNPRITEKASFNMESNVYTFEVTSSATKKQVKSAIATRFGVIPTKVNMAQIPAKTKIVRGKKGVRSGGKKALVFLPKGQTIDVV